MSENTNLKILKCEHIELEEYRMERRVIIGKNKVLMLCPLFSKALEMEVIQDFINKALKFSLSKMQVVDFIKAVKV